MLGIKDNQLIEQYLRGDEKALEFLIDRYLKSIYNFVYRYLGDADEAQEISQEVFVRLWRNVKTFDLSRNFKPWIFSIAKNACLDWLKKKKALRFSDFDKDDGTNTIVDTLVDPDPLPDEVLERVDLKEILSDALNELSPPYRAVLVLHYQEQLTFREIAEAFNEPIDTIKSRHRRGLIKLRELLVDFKK